MKSHVMDQISIFLLKEGFTVKSLTGSSFDILTRNRNRILLLKILEDANSVTQRDVSEMEQVATYISATPLIIAEKSAHKLEDNVIYTRFGLITLNPVTFAHAIRNHLPYIKSTKAGLTTAINGMKLQQQREAKGFSLHEFSKKIGVSSRMVTKYESGQAEITIQKARKVYDLFGTEVFQPVNIFSYTYTAATAGNSKVAKKYYDLGFSATDTKKVPFDIIARKDEELIVTDIGDTVKRDFNAISQLLDADKLVIFSKRKPKNIPALHLKEFLKLQKANELIKIVKER